MGGTLDLLVILIVAVVFVSVLFYALDRLGPRMPEPARGLVTLLVVLFVVVLCLVVLCLVVLVNLLQRAGLLGL